MATLEIKKDGFYIDGQKTTIIGGDIHYFRIHPDDWRERLAYARDFGLNVVQVYVPWNAHEVERGVYDFSGMLDLGRFLSLCAEMGLYVFLRPSPFICSEWDLGGLPARLLAGGGMEIRSSDPRYLAEVREYYERLVPEFLPYLSTHGGPILAVAVENEYGSYGNDHAYLRALADMLTDLGVNVPLYTTDGYLHMMAAFGHLDGVHSGLNFGVEERDLTGAQDTMEKLFPDSPLICTEFWCGCCTHWGEPFHRQDPTAPAKAFENLLKADASVIFYMFAGGTSFGFMSGANYGRSFFPRPENAKTVRYIPQTTSYDTDALIAEDGNPTEKYFLCRDVLDRAMGRTPRPHTIKKRKTAAYTVTLTERADLFDNLDVLTERIVCAPAPLAAEDMGQSHGLTLYRTTADAIPEGDALTLRLGGLRDRAAVFYDGEYICTEMRDRGVRMADGAHQSYIPFRGTGKPVAVDVLTENLGHINVGAKLRFDKKGITEGIYCDVANLFGYKMHTLPLSDLSRLRYVANTAAAHRNDHPVFLRGHFTADPTADTFVSFEGFGHGYIYVNGVNLGRYDGVGPQTALYLPRGFIKEENEIVILDIAPTSHKATVQLLDHPAIEGDGAEII